MKAEMISESTLKVTLTAEDMSVHNLSYEELTAKGAQCRKTLEKLLTGLDPSKNAIAAARLLGEERRLFVEAFRRMDGGCMLYVSAAASPKRQKPLLDESREASPIQFQTFSQSALEQLLRCLEMEKEQGALFTSRLFRKGECFRLAVIPQNTCRTRLLRIFSEFGEAITGELAAAYTEEHFELIVDS